MRLCISGRVESICPQSCITEVTQSTFCNVYDTCRTCRTSIGTDVLGLGVGQGDTHMTTAREKTIGTLSSAWRHAFGRRVEQSGSSGRPISKAALTHRDFCGATCLVGQECVRGVNSCHSGVKFCARILSIGFVTLSLASSNAM